MSTPAALKKEFKKACPDRQAEIIAFARKVAEAVDAAKIGKAISEGLEAERTVGVRKLGPELDSAGRENARIGNTEYVKEPDWSAREKAAQLALKWHSFVADYDIGRPINRTSFVDDPGMTEIQHANAHVEKLRGSPVYRDAVLELVIKVAIETADGREKLMELMDRYVQSS